VKTEAELDRLRSAGPLAVLGEVTAT